MSARRSPSPLQVLRTVGSAAGGLGLAAGLGAVAVVRRDKPLHAYGRVGTGTLTVLGEGPASGVPLLDHPGRHRCTARSSRAMSLAHHGPDVMGVALRTEGGVGLDHLVTVKRVKGDGFAAADDAHAVNLDKGQPLGLIVHRLRYKDRLPVLFGHTLHP